MLHGLFLTAHPGGTLPFLHALPGSTRGDRTWATEGAIEAQSHGFNVIPAKAGTKIRVEVPDAGPWVPTSVGMTGCVLGIRSATTQAACAGHH